MHSFTKSAMSDVRLEGAQQRAYYDNQNLQYLADFRLIVWRQSVLGCHYHSAFILVLSQSLSTHKRSRPYVERTSFRMCIQLKYITMEDGVIVRSNMSLRRGLVTSL